MNALLHCCPRTNFGSSVERAAYGQVLWRVQVCAAERLLGQLGCGGRCGPSSSRPSAAFREACRSWSTAASTTPSWWTWPPSTRRSPCSPSCEPNPGGPEQGHRRHRLQGPAVQGVFPDVEGDEGQRPPCLLDGRYIPKDDNHIRRSYACVRAPPALPRRARGRGHRGRPDHRRPAQVAAPLRSRVRPAPGTARARPGRRRRSRGSRPGRRWRGRTRWRSRPRSAGPRGCRGARGTRPAGRGRSPG
jgi:hypothetical protein